MDANLIFFSIIIPTYNRSEFVINSINSVLSQTYENFELIIVDDGSTDDTEAVVSKIKDRRLHYYKKENAERGAARNYGVNIAQGEYINFLDSDDLLYENHLSVALNFIETEENLWFFHLGYDIKTSDGILMSQVDNLSENVGFKLIKGNNLSCNGVFLRKDILIENRFSEVRDLSGFEDWELWLRLVSRYKLYYRNTITSTVINHDMRSVLSSDKEALIRRQELLLESLAKDKIFNDFFGHQTYVLQASLHTYVALHLAITKKYRKDAIRYLLKGLKLNPKEIFTRRFFAIIKHLIL
jgi:glycosyltransferase involved in cell wall biosynthesis